MGKGIDISAKPSGGAFTSSSTRPSMGCWSTEEKIAEVVGEFLTSPLKEIIAVAVLAQNTWINPVADDYGVWLTSPWMSSLMLIPTGSGLSGDDTSLWWMVYEAGMGWERITASPGTARPPHRRRRSTTTPCTARTAAPAPVPSPRLRTTARRTSEAMIRWAAIGLMTRRLARGEQPAVHQAPRP
ncbi:hypothetical protein AB0H37_42930 [Actinomadura sp. NPDC023710]|uniref:hypothetical protein n=1 Tax=Actinomadura sp. NPDC023710 TaxID=3158219 RepID=UPI0033E4C62D